ncbi:hypothetical protein AV530_006571 [Patagioenas fasciata monilis]|uniref:Uncharacterized protein n=1 Tax=Patagioenas fasciata monilis TaxID=372326 RepID=A0A1V4KH38_PATFA|nr:hypothetical protein AV530_006571 [Patagioenas fasciata monilis]
MLWRAPMAGEQKDDFQEPKTQSDGTTLRRTTTPNSKRRTAHSNFAAGASGQPSLCTEGAQRVPSPASLAAVRGAGEANRHQADTPSAFNLHPESFP